MMAWGSANRHVLLTNDLDFGAMLATSGLSEPSVVQLRSKVTLPAFVGAVVALAVNAAQSELQNGALMTIDAGRFRLRLLPLHNS